MHLMEKFIKTKSGLEIYTESFGAMNQGIFWYDVFCKKLSDSGYFVVRFDHRDTGFSSVIDYSSNPYNLLPFF
ncbi:TPA: hypothetical protein DEP58_04415 [Patescibacteria group bacterium]|nr:hypothetical protein [Patescibacteria group bacterium]